MTRPHSETILRLLHNLGGDINILDTTLNTPLFKEIMSDLPPCNLGFNAVGGNGVTDLARALAPGGTIVTYGGMSKQAPVIPLDLLTDKNLNFKGFWMTHWNNTHSPSERMNMINDICKMIEEKELSYFYEFHDLDDFEYALQRATKPYSMRKVILYTNFPNRFEEHDKLTEKAYDRFNYPLTHG